MKPVNVVRKAAKIYVGANQALWEIREGTANQSTLINNKLNELMAVSEAQLEYQRIQTEMMAEFYRAYAQKLGLDVNLGRFEDPHVEVHAPMMMGYGESNDHFQKPPAAGQSGESLKETMEKFPLMIDAKTWNTSHPKYDANAVRNFPGRILGADRRCTNPLYLEIKQMAKDGKNVPDKAWDSVLQQMMAEAKTVPGFDQVMERKAYIERYMEEKSREFGAHYVAGWVNIEDALFLYWMVRKFKPKTIVQTGVCNGLSSAFMMLALAKNGSEGHLHVIDLPAVFNPNDPAWTVKGKVYGVVIPEGKSSGWIVPDVYKDRFHVHVGDAKLLMPKLVDEIDSIDMFYHDSDHTYDHMMFEFDQAMRKLTPGGLVVGDDISWNASVWDFADKHNIPSFNYKGAVGLAFFSK